MLDFIHHRSCEGPSNRGPAASSFHGGLFGIVSTSHGSQAVPVVNISHGL